MIQSMATLTAALLHGGGGGGIEKNTPRSKRKLQKQLRSSGLAYISRTGKLIPAKQVPEELCQCPQKCDERVPKELRERLFNHFYGLRDTDMQNAFLRDHMDVKARLHLPDMNNTNTTSYVTSSGSVRSPRRITCKYLVPLLPDDDVVDVCQKAFVSAFVITTKRVRLQREKLISSLGLNSYGHAKQLQHINNNNKLVLHSENEQEEDDSPSASPRPLDLKVRHDFDVEKYRRKMIDDPLIPLGLIVPDGVTIAPVTVSPDHDRDIAIVNNFFSNQLWKPEYLLGTYS